MIKHKKIESKVGGFIESICRRCAHHVSLLISWEVTVLVFVFQVGVWTGCRDVEACVPGDKAMRRVVARVDSDGGSNLLPVHLG
jgi:hypothetical protein